MKNGEHPVNPLAQGYYNINGEEKYINGIGLTKREAFAMAAMQGLLSAGLLPDVECAVQVSVKAADALLKALEG